MSYFLYASLTKKKVISPSTNCSGSY